MESSVRDRTRDEARREARFAASTFDRYALFHSSKWMWQLVTDFHRSQSEAIPPVQEADERERVFWKRHMESVLCEEKESESERDTIEFAIRCMQFGEYARGSHSLRQIQGSRAVFVRLHARYLVGEERAEQERIERAGILNSDSFFNTEADPIRKELDGMSSGFESCLNPFYLYLYALSFKNCRDDAKVVFCLTRAIDVLPWFRPAWSLLYQLMEETDLVSISDVRFEEETRNHWIFSLCISELNLRLQRPSAALKSIEPLVSSQVCSEGHIGLLPGTLSSKFSDTIHSNPPFFSSEALTVARIRAQAFLDLRDIEASCSEFEHVIRQDPFSVENIDVYSNLLYIQEEKSALSRLAHACHVINKYTPETCIVVANYYSLRRQHFRAVVYLRRAIQLNPRYSSAWTLLGHEFIELRNIGAAVYVYRRAVELCRQDFRAWYGLAQTYELLRMPLYALFYFRRACALRPGDARMWCALGFCYQRLQRYTEALECFRRAHPSAHPEWRGMVSSDFDSLPASECYDLQALMKQAAVYELVSNTTMAVRCHELVFEIQSGISLSLLDSSSSALSRLSVDLSSIDPSRAMYLARYYSKHGYLERSKSLCHILIEMGSSERDNAKSLLESISNSLVS